MERSLPRIAGKSGVWLILSMLAFAGCGQSGSSAVSVSGTVTVSGKPLSGATITWEPIERTPGPKATAPIFGGSYRIAESANLQPGTYRVRISMLPPELLKKLEKSEGIEIPPPTSVIARQFDADSQLTVELKSGQENQFDCDVSFSGSRGPRR